MKKEKIKVLFLSAEISPLAKVGGLADVCGALPKALDANQVEIRMCLPFYGSIRIKGIKKIADRIGLKMGNSDEHFSLWQVFLPGTKIPVYLIKHPLFSSKNIYASSPGEIDNAKRFSFFSKAALAAARHLSFRPDIIHCHDWHTALTPLLIKAQTEALDEFFSCSKILYTIHNLANQGKTSFNISKYAGLDIPIDSAALDSPEFNFMAQGIEKANLINTVSPTYAKEILTKEQGAGLETILKKRKHSLYGILNGLDVDSYSPAADKSLIKNYSVEKLADGKNKNKLPLQKELGFKMDKNICLIGLVARLDWQKGIDLITDKLVSDLMDSNEFQLVILGTGQKEYEKQLTALEKKYPRQVKVRLEFNEKLARRIYAASDIFLVPSRFEPCGLTQMIAMRYGAIPVIRATGGLKDTVDSKVGFSFKDYSTVALGQALKKALKMYYNKPIDWKKLQAQGMKRDFSWKKSAKEYLNLYNLLIK